MASGMAGSATKLTYEDFVLFPDDGKRHELIDGELWIGSMIDARKAHDLRRDPRFALHSGSDDPSEWQGDAKLGGVAEEVAADATDGGQGVVGGRREAQAALEPELRADDQLQRMFPGRHVSANHARERALVGQGERVVTEGCGPGDECLWVRGTAQESEVGEAMELGVLG